jgi:polyhydroxybutyrate depolymerase
MKHPALLLLAAAASLLVSADAGAGKRCRRLCAPDIAVCRAACVSGRRRRCRARCRTSVIGRCRSNPDPQCLPATTTTTTSTTLPGCDGGGAATGFDPAVHVTSSGTDRTYSRFVPPDYAACRAYPVVFAFHGDGGTGAGVRATLALEPQASGAAIFVYPDATETSGRSWQLDVPLIQNADMTLFVDILNQLASAYHVDRSRVFATGFSRGAYFVNFLNCRLGTTYLRAVAPHSGSGPYGQPADFDVDGHFICEAPAAAAMLIHGETDGVVPIADAEYSRGQWVWANHCADTTTPATPTPCVDHDGCDAGKPVVWCAIPGLGHAPWTGAPAAIWQFFATFPAVP